MLTHHIGAEDGRTGSRQIPSPRPQARRAGSETAAPPATMNKSRSIHVAARLDSHEQQSRAPGMATRWPGVAQHVARFKRFAMDLASRRRVAPGRWPSDRALHRAIHKAAPRLVMTTNRQELCDAVPVADRRCDSWLISSAGTARSVNERIVRRLNGGVAAPAAVPQQFPARTSPSASGRMRSWLNLAPVPVTNSDSPRHRYGTPRLFQRQVWLPRQLRQRLL